MDDILQHLIYEVGKKLEGKSPQRFDIPLANMGGQEKVLSALVVELKKFINSRGWSAHIRIIRARVGWVLEFFCVINKPLYEPSDEGEFI